MSRAGSRRRAPERRPRPGGVAYGEKPYGSDGGVVAVGTTVASSGAP
ncbi:hypothetical protein [Cellulosimicrobium funkei]